MGHCELCGTEQAFPFECCHCGGTFCVVHRFPENHLCRVNKDHFSKDQSTPKDNAPTEEEQFRKPVNASEKKTFNKIVLVALALILGALITSGILLGTSLNYPSGHTDENANGYAAGYANGNSTGYLAGYAEGNSSGYAAGYTDGNSIAYLAGCTDGNSSGYVAGYQKGFKDAVSSAYTIRDPSYQEMVSFLASDETDAHEYDEINYNCYDYASDVCNHALEARYRCGFVYIELSNSTGDAITADAIIGHAIVCFNTTDKGLIFIEPQHDWEVSLTIGKPITAIFPEWNFSIELIPEIVVDYGIIW